MPSEHDREPSRQKSLVADFISAATFDLSYRLHKRPPKLKKITNKRWLEQNHTDSVSRRMKRRNRAKGANGACTEWKLAILEGCQRCRPIAMSEVEKQLVAIEMVRASKTAPVAASTATPAAQRTGAAVPPADALAPAVVRADASNSSLGGEGLFSERERDTMRGCLIVLYEADDEHVFWRTMLSGQFNGINVDAVPAGVPRDLGLVWKRLGLRWYRTVRECVGDVRWVLAIARSRDSTNICSNAPTLAYKLSNLFEATLSSRYLLFGIVPEAPVAPAKRRVRIRTEAELDHEAKAKKPTISTCDDVLAMREDVPEATSAAASSSKAGGSDRNNIDRVQVASDPARQVPLEPLSLLQLPEEDREMQWYQDLEQQQLFEYLHREQQERQRKQQQKLGRPSCTLDEQCAKTPKSEGNNVDRGLENGAGNAASAASPDPAPSKIENRGKAETGKVGEVTPPLLPPTLPPRFAVGRDDSRCSCDTHQAPLDTKPIFSSRNLSTVHGLWDRGGRGGRGGAHDGVDRGVSADRATTGSFVFGSASDRNCVPPTSDACLAKEPVSPSTVKSGVSATRDNNTDATDTQDSGKTKNSKNFTFSFDNMGTPAGKAACDSTADKLHLSEEPSAIFGKMRNQTAVAAPTDGAAASLKGDGNNNNKDNNCSSNNSQIKPGITFNASATTRQPTVVAANGSLPLGLSRGERRAILREKRAELAKVYKTERIKKHMLQKDPNNLMGRLMAKDAKTCNVIKSPSPSDGPAGPCDDFSGLVWMWGLPPRECAWELHLKIARLNATGLTPGLFRRFVNLIRGGGDSGVLAGALPNVEGGVSAAVVEERRLLWIRPSQDSHGVLWQLPGPPGVTRSDGEIQQKDGIWGGDSANEALVMKIKARLWAKEIATAMLRYAEKDHERRTQLSQEHAANYK